MAASGEDTVDATANRCLVVDEAAFEEQFLRCSVCQEKYSSDERPPKSLPCNHTFCLTCLKQVFDHHQPNARRALAWADENIEGVLKCPSCRVEIYLSRSEIGVLPTDHRVIQMLDFLSQVTVKAQNVCSKHERQPLNFFCKSCLLPICRDCTVLDHKEGQGHEIVDVSAALSENSEDFNEADNKTKQILEKLKTRTDALANSSKRLDILERQLRGTIKDTFIEYRLLLERRQEAMIDMMKTMIRDQKQKINARFVDVCTTGTDCQKLYDNFSKARTSNDVKELFTARQKMKEKEEEFKESAEVNDDELFKSCIFGVQNEGVFLSELSSLGEVESKEDPELKNPVPAHQLVVLDLEDRRAAESINPFDCEEYYEPRENDNEENTQPGLASRLRRIRYSTDLDQPGEEGEDSNAALSRLRSRLLNLETNNDDLLSQLRTGTTTIEERGDDNLSANSPSRQRDRNTSSRSGRQRSSNFRVVRHPSQHQNYSSTRYSGNENR